jgi:hypothetical protein
VLWRGLEGEKAPGAAVSVRLVERRQVVLTVAHTSRWKPHAEVGARLTSCLGGERLLLDLAAQIAELRGDGGDQPGQLLGHSGCRSCLSTDQGQGELAHKVLGVDLGCQEQLGRDLAQVHLQHVLGFFGAGPQVDQLVRRKKGSQQVVGVLGCLAGQLGPYPLAGTLSLDSSPDGEGLDDHQPPTGHGALTSVVTTGRRG